MPGQIDIVLQGEIFRNNKHALKNVIFTSIFSKLSIYTFLSWPTEKPIDTARKGSSIATKCDYARPNWQSSSGKIVRNSKSALKNVIFTSIFSKLKINNFLIRAT